MPVNNVIAMICAFAMLGQPLFFSFMGLLGIEYDGSDSSNVYVAYIIIIATMMLFIYAYGVVIKGVLKKEFFIVILIVFSFALHILWVLFDPIETELIPRFLVFFILFGLPGFFAATTIIKLDLIPQLIRICEVFFLIMALGIVTFSVLPSFAGVKVASLAGASYQTLSYYSAFIFGILLIYNLHLPEVLRFPCVRFFWYKILSYGLLLGCLLGCLLGGGRGAFVLLIAYLLMVLPSVFLHKRNFLTQRAMLNASLKFFSIVFVFIVFFSYFWDRDFVQSGFNRATQFISSDGAIDLERGSSGRHVVYQNAARYIVDSPLIGYGPFGFRDKTIHAHNFFLEVLLQFGVVGLSVFLLLIGLMLVNAIRNWSFYNYWVFGLFLYPLVMTMFSGAYLHSSLYCFGIAFMTVYKTPRFGVSGPLTTSQPAATG